MTRQYLTLLFAFASFASATAPVQIEQSEREAIRKVTLNYIDGLYSRDAGLVRRTIAPALAASLGHDNDSLFRLMDRNSKAKKGEDNLRGVLIFDRYGDAAIVRADLTQWISYLQMTKTHNQWLITSILMTPRSAAAPSVLNDAAQVPLLPDWNVNPLSRDHTGRASSFVQ